MSVNKSRKCISILPDTYINEEKREFSSIIRINHQRTVTISGDIDADVANTSEVIADTRNRFLSELQQRYPGMFISLEGEVKNSQETSLQAQVLVPLVASVVFGMISSTFLLLLVLPAAYAIMEDLGIREIEAEEMAFIEQTGG